MEFQGIPKRQRGDKSPEQVKGERKKGKKKKSQKGEGTPPDRADFSLVNCFTQGFYVPFLSLFSLPFLIIPIFFMSQLAFSSARPF